MKKTFKKLFAVLLAAALVLTMAVPAFAEDSSSDTADAAQTGNGSITITNAVAGKTYTIYRIFDLESHFGENYSYKVNAAWTAKHFENESIFKTNFTVNAGGYVLKNDVYNEAAAADFAKSALSFAKTNSIAAVNTQTPEDDGELKFSGLPLGYYLVDSSVGALCNLTTTDDNARIEEKNTVPSVGKKILEGTTPVDSNVAKIGDKISYQVTIQAKKGAESYVLTDKLSGGFFETEADTLSAGLTFNNDVKVTVNDAELPKSNYTVTPGQNNDFTVTFTQAYLDTIAADTNIIVTYSATLNTGAIIDGNGNSNSVNLKYGNEHTVTSKTTTYSRQFDLVKTGSDNNLLAGAKFELYDAKNGGKKIPLFKIDEHTYRVAVGDEAVSEIETVSNGKITIRGLANKTYWLEETQQPTGYNTLVGRVEVNLTEGSQISTMTSTATTWADGNGGIHIVNNAGALLPGTGGMGTTLFYVIGGGLMVAAAVLLITKKRMERKN